jgi:integral membrane protein
MAQQDAILRQFRIVSILEGISYLLLLLIGMPLKYFAAMPLPNKVIGLAHGVLFVLYLAYLGIVYFKHKWTLWELFVGFLASLVPLGTFFTHKIHEK